MNYEKKAALMRELIPYGLEQPNMSDDVVEKIINSRRVPLSVSELKIDTVYFDLLSQRPVLVLSIDPNQKRAEVLQYRDHDGYHRVIVHNGQLVVL